MWARLLPDWDSKVYTRGVARGNLGTAGVSCLSFNLGTAGVSRLLLSSLIGHVSC